MLRRPDEIAGRSTGTSGLHHVQDAEETDQVGNIGRNGTAPPGERCMPVDGLREVPRGIGQTCSAIVTASSVLNRWRNAVARETCPPWRR